MKHSECISSNMMVVLCTMLCSIILLALPAAAGWPMVDPAIDEPDQPFCYFSRPTDQLGVMDHENGFMVTCEGYIFTRCAEIVFMTGKDRTPVHQRIRTLDNGNMPVVNYSVQDGDIEYTWKMFAATSDGQPMSPLGAFVRVTMKNTSDKPAVAYFGTALRYKGITDRSGIREDYPFLRRAWYDVYTGAIMRNDEAYLFLPESPKRDIMTTLEEPWNGPFDGAEHDVVESTPVCPALWDVTLKPNEKRTVDLYIPLDPVPKKKVPEVAKRVRGAFDTYLKKTHNKWQELYNRAIDIQIPEDKAHNTFWTSMANVAIARDQVASNHWVQRVNELQYHTGFWHRDATYFALAWWYMGMQEEAQRVMDHFIDTVNEDGVFQGDYENISAFAITKWYSISGNREFASNTWEALWKNFLVMKQRRTDDPLGLMPACGPYDNEGINGHYTGHNFYNIAALRMLVQMADDLGHTNEAEQIRKEHMIYRTNFLARLERNVKQYGYIPPGMDTGTNGANWGNLTASYPTGVLPPDHPWIAMTTEKIRRELWEEDIMVFHGLGWHSLHHYDTIKVTYCDLLRGRDDLVVKDLYGLLIHTSGTHGFFEFCINPWSTRDFGGNFSPHGWGAAKFLALVRLMMVREQGKDLYLLSALPPAWVKPGETLTARDIPTTLGTAGLVVKGTERGCVITLDLPKEGGVAGLPQNIYLRIPWYAKNAKVRIDGKDTPIKNNLITIPANAKTVELLFDRDNKEYRDYETVLKNWKKEYRRRYDAWRKREPDASPWEVYPEQKFQTRAERLPRSCELAEREGVSQNKPVTVSSCDQWSKPECVTDGIDSRRAPVWCCANDDPKPTLEIDLQQTSMIQRIRIISCSWSPSLKGVASVSVDGKKWQVVADTRNQVRPDYEGYYEFFFPPVEAAKVRMQFLPGSKPEIRELTVFEKPATWNRPRALNSDAGKNLALGKPVLSSRHEGDWGAWFAVDGRTSYEERYWAAAGPSPQWMVIDLGEVKPVSKTRVYFYAGDDRGYAYRIITSKDGISWNAPVDKTAEPVKATKDGDLSEFPKTQARYVGVVVTKNTANPSAHIAELQVY